MLWSINSQRCLSVVHKHHPDPIRTTDSPSSRLAIIRRPEVERRTGKCRSSIYADPTFPRRVSIGPRAVGWLAHEVDAWIAARVAASRARSS